jgi:hypothetical protein
MAASMTIAPETLESLERIVRIPVRNEAGLVSLVQTLGERVRCEYERGYKAGLEEAQDAGEIVDPESGEKRRLDPAEVAAHAQVAEERWAEGSPRI